MDFKGNQNQIKRRFDHNNKFSISYILHRFNQLVQQVKRNAVPGQWSSQLQNEHHFNGQIPNVYASYSFRLRLISRMNFIFEIFLISDWIQIPHINSLRYWHLIKMLTALSVLYKIHSVKLLNKYKMDNDTLLPINKSIKSSSKMCGEKKGYQL